MAEQTPYQQLRQLDYSVRRLVIVPDADAYGMAGQRAFERLKRDIRMAQEILKDYEMFELEEDLRMQARTLPKAIKQLERTRDSLLKVSEFDLVGPADVAHISAELDELIDRLR